jgi:hypothetical protein
VSDWYILDDENKTIKASMHQWAKWIENNRNKKVVKQEVINDQKLSTVFLGLDHSYGGGPPLLFETMIFEGPHDGGQWRYTTYAEALEGHNQIAERLKTGLPPEDENE